MMSATSNADPKGSVIGSVHGTSTINGLALRMHKEGYQGGIDDHKVNSPERICPAESNVAVQEQTPNSSENLEGSSNRIHFEHEADFASHKKALVEALHSKRTAKQGTRFQDIC
jgi:hypothetical protein